MYLSWSPDVTFIDRQTREVVSESCRGAAPIPLLDAVSVSEE
jgi:hypothetical protein